MTKTQQAHRENKSKPPLPQIPPVKKRYDKKKNDSWISKALKYLLYSAVNIATIVSFIYYFAPKLDIAVAVQPNGNNPFPVRFVITNQSELPIKNILFTYVIKNVNYGRSDIDVSNNKVASTTIPIARLSPLERTSTECNFPIALPFPIVGADMEVSVSYSPLLYLSNQQRVQRYVAIRDVSGSFNWMPKALSE